ncbi:dual specificity tyrosine-phosphorylation-regulated kinase [Chloropicon primus]|uniref:Dual specificity tyrosine-phosphorylation-regulated kinase n=2 Tax=Chloropicon primus TaxID=1764295 RepID=A0A5B8MEB9_9CHLO|nr:dual specificity tyrosine-phosphorylation-regulated kinase [Chloropicon primus]|eukprot:QDZ18769.1 dual specificity tyrosine-phosphorylation-regulated kinase [Chloropicon primus]
MEEEFWKGIGNYVPLVSEDGPRCKAEWLARNNAHDGSSGQDVHHPEALTPYRIRSFDKRDEVMKWFRRSEIEIAFAASPAESPSPPCRRESLLTASFLGLSCEGREPKQEDPSSVAGKDECCGSLSGGFSFPTTPSCNDDDEEREDPRIGWPQSPMQQLTFEQQQPQLDERELVEQQAEDFTYGSFSSNRAVGVDPGEAYSPSKFTDPASSSCSTSYHKHANLGSDAGSLDENETEEIMLRVIRKKKRTGLEASREFVIQPNAPISISGTPYKIVELIASSTFSRVVKAIDVQSGSSVSIKIINNTKESFDAGLDEVRLLKLITEKAEEDGDADENLGFVKMLDYFYKGEHLFIVCENLRENLFHFADKNKSSNCANYFTLARIQTIARQLLQSLHKLHSLGIIHSDLKPENILFETYSKCKVKIIDLGSARFIHEGEGDLQNLQSLCYRAPEVVLGAGYDERIDLFSLGCILGELYTGRIVFPCHSHWSASPANQQASLLAEWASTFGAFPSEMLQRSRKKSVTKSGLIYIENSSNYELVLPNRIPLAQRIKPCDPMFLDFLLCLLVVEPKWRMTAAEALEHPWLKQKL